MHLRSLLLLVIVDQKIDVAMKFGGSSLADHERVDHVAKLIKNQLENEGCRPRAVVCSAMGKTTNSLLSAGEFALGTSPSFLFYRFVIISQHNVSLDPF